jgi:phenylacetate-CoA ligase
MGSALETIYPFTPIWAQNLGITLYGLAWRQERLGGRFDEHVAAYRQRDRWSEEQMSAYVQRELERTLLQAFEAVPHYRGRWEAAGLWKGDIRGLKLRDLRHLPVVSKEDLRRRPEAFLSEDEAVRRRVRRQMTSGSSGTPITAVCTVEEHRQFIAAREVRSFAWAGGSIRSSRAMIGGRRVVPEALSAPPFHRYNAAERQVYLSAYHISPANVPAYVSALNRYRPRMLTGYAAAYTLLGRMMLERGMRLDYDPDALVLSSEKLTGEMKEMLQSAFRARAFEEYGAVENCVLATECEAGGLHAHPDFGILEIVDADGEPVPAEVPGRILCTSLIKAAQPLIRYEIGDIGMWSARRCACGRAHLPLLKELVGRLEDVVIGPDGREMVRFHGIFIGLPHVTEAQGIQEERAQFTVRLVPCPGFGDAETKLIRQRFQERLGPVEVRVEVVKTIPRGENGKFRAVISKLKTETPGLKRATPDAAMSCYRN